MRARAIAVAAGAFLVAGAVSCLLLLRAGPRRAASTTAPPPNSGGRSHKLIGGFSGYGWSTQEETKAAVDQAIAQATVGARGEPDVTFVFYSHQHAPARVVEALGSPKGSPRRACGWSSYHGVLTPDGYHASPQGVIGVMPLRLPDVSVGVGAATFGEAESPEAAARLALRRATEDAGPLPPGRRLSMIVMSTTYDGNEERVLESLRAATDGPVPVLGGTAAGSPQAGSSDWSVIANGQVIRSGLALCVFYSASPFAWSFQGGFHRTGKSGVVTASDGRVIREIDGRPALDVYDEWSGGRVGEAMRAGKDMNTFAALYPLCKTLTSGTATHNLFVHAWPPEDGAATKRLVTSANLWKGERVFFSEGSWNILLNRLGALPRLAREEAPDVHPAAALLICCEAVLKNIPPGQRDQMAFLVSKSLGDVPWIGVFTWGEQGNFRGVGNYHGNLLTSVVLLPQAASDGE